MAPVITCIEDLRKMARRRVPRMFYDYVDAGSWTESTYRDNERDFQKVRFHQRVAVNLEDRSLASTMIGEPVRMPVALAPTGLTGMQHADGEILAARAAEKFGIPFTLSTMSICSIEDVAAHTHSPSAAPRMVAWSWRCCTRRSRPGCCSAASSAAGCHGSDATDWP